MAKNYIYLFISLPLRCCMLFTVALCCSFFALHFFYSCSLLLILVSLDLSPSLCLPLSSLFFFSSLSIDLCCSILLSVSLCTTCFSLLLSPALLWSLFSLYIVFPGSLLLSLAPFPILLLALFYFSPRFSLFHSTIAIFLFLFRSIHILRTA